MIAEVRETLRSGDKVIVTKYLTPPGWSNNSNTNLYGMIGTVTDKRYEHKSPEHAYTFFMVDFGDGVIRHCTAYNCDKIIEDADGFMRVVTKSNYKELKEVLKKEVTQCTQQLSNC